jgi:hypothetical protein
MRASMPVSILNIDTNSQKVSIVRTAFKSLAVSSNQRIAPGVLHSWIRFCIFFSSGFFDGDDILMK